MKRNLEGDIFRLQTDKGFGYLHLIKNPIDNTELELLKVYLKPFTKEINDFSVLRNYNSFFIQFPLKAAVRRKIVFKVGNLMLIEKDAPPTLFRTEHIFGDGWQIVDSENCKRNTVKKLTKEQIQLSPWGAMNDTKIIELIDSDWSLEKMEIKSQRTTTVNRQ